VVSVAGGILKSLRLMRIRCVRILEPAPPTHHESGLRCDLGRALLGRLLGCVVDAAAGRLVRRHLGRLLRDVVVRLLLAERAPTFNAACPRFPFRCFRLSKLFNKIRFKREKNGSVGKADVSLGDMAAIVGRGFMRLRRPITSNSNVDIQREVVIRPAQDGARVL
jgi:hypothetical protein